MGRLSSVIHSGAQRRSQWFPVGVGITIAHDPLHGSGRAGFPHPALALGDNAHAPQRIGMTDRRQRQPVLPYVHGVCDRAGLWCTSRYRCARCGLPLSPTASASRSKILTRLHTRPARSSVNASTPPSRAAPHDSRPMWVATPRSYDFFIHYNLAGLAGAQEKIYAICSASL
jgi:hypothetical protein